jgi:anaerobic magnesium-protoporphyrin IX monomethyl ester cyclase
MKVLLVYPVPPKTHWPIGVFRSHWVPTGIASIAGCLLRRGHEVKILVREQQLVECNFDWSAANEQLVQLLRDFRPDILGLSIVTPVLSEAQSIAKLARENCPHGVIIVAGGPHPTALPEQTLRECPDIDAAAVGEGEETMVELAGAGISPKVAGLVIRDGDGFLRTPPRPPVADLDSLPKIPYELFDMRYFLRPSRWMIRWLKLSTLNIRTSRGCTNRCLFCAGNVVSGLGVRYHSLDRVMDDIETAVEKFHVQAIHFEDETIGARRERLLELCERIRREGYHKRVKWECSLRVDQADAELLGEMKSAGCIQVEYGIESGSEKSLETLGKQATLDANRRAVLATRAAGLRIFADIMVGLPGETEKDFDATVDFMRWARPEVINLAKLVPLPGTPLYDSLTPEQLGRLSWADYAYFDRPGVGLNLTAMPDDVFDRKYRRLRKYFLEPHLMLSMLRDPAMRDGEDRELRRRFRRKLAKFVLLHPILATHVPW